jgi:pentatricopeptide repeat protein
MLHVHRRWLSSGLAPVQAATGLSANVAETVIDRLRNIPPPERILANRVFMNSHCSEVVINNHRRELHESCLERFTKAYDKQVIMGTRASLYALKSFAIVKNFDPIEVSNFALNYICPTWKLDGECYAVLIDSFCKRKMFAEAKELIAIMVEKDAHVSPDLFLLLIQSFASNGAVDDAIQFLHDALDHGVVPDLNIFNPVLEVMSLEASRADEAMKLLEGMVDSGIMPNDETFHNLFHGFAKAGCIDQLEQVYEIATPSNHYPRKSTVISMIESSCKMDRADFAIKVYSDFLKSGETATKSMVDSIVSGLVQINRCQDASQFVRSVPPDMVDSQTILPIVDGLAREKLMVDAKAMVDELSEQIEISPNVHHALMVGYAECKMFNEMFPVFEKLQLEKYPLDITVFDSLLESSCASGHVDEAAELLKLLKIQGVLVRLSILNKIIHEKSKSCSCAEIVSFINDNKELGFQPTILTLSSILTGLQENATLERSDLDHVFRFIEENNIEMTSMFYSNLISLYCKHGMIQDAVESICQAREAMVNIQPSVLLKLITDAEQLGLQSQLAPLAQSLSFDVEFDSLLYEVYLKLYIWSAQEDVLDLFGRGCKDNLVSVSAMTLMANFVASRGNEQICLSALNAMNDKKVARFSELVVQALLEHKQFSMITEVLQYLKAKEIDVPTSSLEAALLGALEMDKTEFVAELLSKFDANNSGKLWSRILEPLLKYFGRKKLYKPAYRAWKAALRSGFTTNREMYSLLIQICLKSMDLKHEVFHVFLHSRSSDVLLDVADYNAILNHLIETEAFDQVNAFMSVLETGDLRLTPAMYEKIVLGYLQKKDFDNVTKFFEMQVLSYSLTVKTRQAVLPALRAAGKGTLLARCLKALKSAGITTAQ